MTHQEDEYPLKYPDRIRLLIPDYDGMKHALVAKVKSLRYESLPLRVLELGVGGGEITAELLSDTQIEVMAVDYSKSVCSFLHRKLDIVNSRLEIIHGDVNDHVTWISVAQRKPFDAVLATLLIHDIYMAGEQAVQAFLHRCSEVLRPGGLFIYADPTGMGRGVTTALVQEWQDALPLSTKSLEQFQNADPLFFKPPALTDLGSLSSHENLVRCEIPWLSMHFALIVFKKEIPDRRV